MTKWLPEALIVAGLIALTVVMFAAEHRGHQRGLNEARAASEKAVNTELREKNLALDAMHRAVQQRERANVDAAVKVAADHLKEKGRVEADRDRALAAVRAGRLRLRVAEAGGRNLVCMPAAGPGAAGSEPATQETGLPEPRDEAVVRLLSEADAVVVELNKCWRTVRADRGLPEPAASMGSVDAGYDFGEGSTTAARRSPMQADPG